MSNEAEHETVEYVDITPSNEGHAHMLWEIAMNHSQYVKREWAKMKLIRGYLAGKE